MSINGGWKYIIMQITLSKKLIQLCKDRVITVQNNSLKKQKSFV